MLLLSRASTICNLLINWELSHKSHHQCTVATKYINDIDIFNIQLDIDRIWEVGILRMRILSLLHDGFIARMLTLGLYTLSATLQIPPKAVFIFQRGKPGILRMEKVSKAVSELNFFIILNFRQIQPEVKMSCCQFRCSVDFLEQGRQLCSNTFWRPSMQRKTSGVRSLSTTWQPSILTKV